MKNLKTPTVVGNVQFTEKGVSVVCNYSSDEERVEYYATCHENFKKRKVKTLEAAKAAIAARIAHCEKELNANVANAILVTECQVCWKNGHFSIPVYQAMVDFLQKDPKTWDEISISVLQQIVRAIYLQRYDITGHFGPELNDAFNIATEILCCKSK